MEIMVISKGYMIWVDVIFAFATHAWLRNHEPKSIGRLLVALAIIPSPVAYRWHSSLEYSTIWQPYAVFILTLLGSIIIYRVSPFHPLAQHPGPLPCKISKLWTAFISYQGKLHQYHQELHTKYGPIVRVGPNELSIIDKEFIPHILGSPGLPKGPQWDGRSFTSPDKSNDNRLISVKDFHRHAELRKPWNQAFKSTPLKSYEEILLQRATQLTSHLEKVCMSSADLRGHIDLAKWISFLSFDFMGDIAFGGGFELMRDGDKGGLWENMEAGLFLPSILQHIPWVAPVIRATPFVGASIKKFATFAVKQATLRCTKVVQKRDLFCFMLDELDSHSKNDPFPFIVNNAVLAIIAGSDTTSSALSNIIYYLLRYPEYFRRLRRETDEVFSFADCTSIDISQLPSMKLLNAVINETLRLQPPLPTSLQRASTKSSGGKVVGDTFIPEGTAVIIPPYALHRHPAYFSPRPEEFWPERWLMQNDEQVILNLGAYIPFSFGPANCAGKPLAMQELRYLTALLVRQFDITFESGFAPETWEKNLEDRFVLSKGPLPVVLTPRKT
ncbi:cytochrome P450 [Flammula alnicola]|nr:cytochrome P450 [Flammula alnicola]